jgi:hypothetical protein
MNHKNYKKRSELFRWHSKQELYDYCKETFGLMQHHVDREIAEVKKEFKLRKYRPINVEELWQKVGLKIEKKFIGGE